MLACVHPVRPRQGSAQQLTFEITRFGPSFATNHGTYTKVSYSFELLSIRVPYVLSFSPLWTLHRRWRREKSLANFDGRVRYVFLCRLRFDGFRYTAYVLAGSLDRLLRPPSQVLLPHHPPVTACVK